MLASLGGSISGKAYDSCLSLQVPILYARSFDQLHYQCRGQFYEVGLIPDKSAAAARTGAKTLLCPRVNAIRDRHRSHTSVALKAVNSLQVLLQEGFGDGACRMGKMKLNVNSLTDVEILMLTELSMLLSLAAFKADDHSSFAMDVDDSGRWQPLAKHDRHRETALVSCSFFPLIHQAMREHLVAAGMTRSIMTAAWVWVEV